MKRRRSQPYERPTRRAIGELGDKATVDSMAEQIVAIIAEAEERRISDGLKAIGFDALED
jgi:hypothetical protein